MIAKIREISAAAIVVALCPQTAALADDTIQDLARKHGEAFELAEIVLRQITIGRTAWVTNLRSTMSAQAMKSGPPSPPGYSNSR